MLPDRGRSYAVLIGTSHYRSPELPRLPAVRQNLDDLQAVLTDPALGWLDPAHCVVAANTRDVRTVYRALRDSAMAAEDTLFVYFAGHGRVGARNELFLSLADTDPDALQVSALAYDLVRDALNHSPAANRVVVLDCCFSGRVVDDMAGDVIGQLEVEGTYVLAATPPNAVALAPRGATHTAFTGMLLELLGNGLPDAPPLLTLGRIHQELVRTAIKRSLPQPRQRGTGTSQNLALARNAAKIDRSAPVVATSPPPEPLRRHGVRLPVAMVLLLLAVSLAVLGLFLWLESEIGRPYRSSGGAEFGGGRAVYSTSGRYVVDNVDGLVPVLDHGDRVIAMLGGGGDVSALTISDDGKFVAVAKRDEDEVKVYDVDRAAENAKVPESRRVRGTELTTLALALNRDATLLVVDNMVWDLRANRQIGELPVPESGSSTPNAVSGAAFHPTEPDVLALETHESTQLWNVRTLTPVGEALRNAPTLGTSPTREGVGDVDFSADGRLLATKGVLWSLERRERICPEVVDQHAVEALSPNGQSIAVRDGTVHGFLVRVEDCRRFGDRIPFYRDMEFSHDSRWLLVVQSEKTDRVSLES
ncbi:caspase, EACC1-associated type [Lentzea terrae]|uniref:caspase, EACC1-associated type n=1 Tax=Lentzea terrae TaxID=2200761 RepID=UPI00130021BB|nr:caspase family protein [Lentzea terrae]